MKPVDRNQRVYALMQQCFENAQQGHYQVDTATKADFDTLFSTTAWGFREIVLLIVLARLLDKSYSPYTAFYDCNPRPLYEKPIIQALRERQIPSRQSGPLNVAKAAKGLDEQWAAQRRPKPPAEVVVKYAKAIETMPEDQLVNLAIALHARFLEEANAVARLAVEAEPMADPSFLHALCMHLITDVPDAGNTPQRIVGYALQAYHNDLQTGIEVNGHEDRASTTSTTSKKLGDVVEQQADGTLVAAYEVTVKLFGEQRVRESLDAVQAYDAGTGTQTAEITVICRPEDRHPEASGAGTDNVGSYVYLGMLEYQGITYHFVNLSEWIMSQLLRMSSSARLAFFELLSGYIAQPNTAEKVKLRWRQLIGDTGFSQ